MQTDPNKIALQTAVAAALRDPKYVPTFVNPNTQAPNHQANKFNAVMRLMGLPNRADRGVVLTRKFVELKARVESRRER